MGQIQHRFDVSQKKQLKNERFAFIIGSQTLRDILSGGATKSYLGAHKGDRCELDKARETSAPG